MGSATVFNRLLLQAGSFAAALVMLTSCGNPSGIDTPREILRDSDISGISGDRISFTASLNAVPQQLELIRNRFFCRVYRGANTGPYIAIRVELQNTDLSAGMALNSLYFRSDSLPADGAYHSLSGDPTDLSLPGASKLIFLSGGKFLSRIPFEKNAAPDNFRVKLSEAGGRFEAEYQYASRFDDGGGAKDFNVSGSFVIEP